MSGELVRTEPAAIEELKILSPSDIPDAAERAQWFADHIRQRLLEMRSEREGSAVLRQWMIED
jgi:hypothetical protein